MRQSYGHKNECRKTKQNSESTITQKNFLETRSKECL